LEALKLYDRDWKKSRSSLKPRLLFRLEAMLKSIL